MTETLLFDYWRSSASYRVRIALNLKVQEKFMSPNAVHDAVEYQSSLL